MMANRYPNKTTENDIREYVKRLCEQFSPEKIILFGSNATGQATSDSDVDLFVIMNFNGRASETAYEIRKAVPKNFPLDLIVRTPGEIKQRVEMGDLFISEILKKGKVLYEKDRP